MREVEEELGVHGVPLEPLGVADYEDEHTRYHAHRFTVEWDGPIRWQPEEVSWGDWVAVDELVQRLDDEAGRSCPTAPPCGGTCCAVGRPTGRLGPGPGAHGACERRERLLMPARARGVSGRRRRRSPPTAGRPTTGPGESPAPEPCYVARMDFTADEYARRDADRLREVLAGPPVTWVFLGDSITQGVHHTHGRRGYVEHFAERVRGGWDGAATP